MAQLPTIASTANRRILPSADLRVDGVSPAAFGAAVGAGLQQFGDAGADAGKAVQQFELVKRAEANRLAEFDRLTTYVAFESDQKTKLEEAKRDLSGPAQDFTKTSMAAFDTDAAAFLEKIPERDRHAWQARMGQLRAGLAGDALRAEFAQRDSYYKTTIGDTLGKLANGAMSQPDKLDDWRAQGEQIINSSGLSAQDKLEYATRWKGTVSVAAAQGDLQRDPEGLIQRLGGIEHVGRAEAVGAAKAGWQGVATSIAAQFGLKPSEVAAVMSYETGGTFSPTIMGGKGGRYMGLIQFGPEERAKYGITKTSTPAEWTKAIGGFLRDRGFKPGMGVLDLYSTINAGRPGRYKASDGNGTVESHTQKILRDHVKSAESWLAKGADLAPAAEGTPAHNVGTGEVDPRYADIPLEARAQLIGAAQREIDRRQAAAAAADQAAHATWLNDFMTELHDGKAGQADIEAARKAGHLTNIDEISRAEKIVEDRNKERSDINFFNAAMAAPGFVWNPYDEKQQKGVEAAVKAQGGSAQAAFNVWLRTGILADSGAVALRGAMISTNPQQVQGGATIASNMLARNPNAFAAVKGGDEIERNALLYGHYVNDLGFSAEEAGRRVAERNTPEMRSKIQMGQPEQAAFRKRILASNVPSKLSNAFGGWFRTDPEFTSREQMQAASQDYADLAQDHFTRYGDASAAEAFAMAQMRKLYGEVNGRLMKYPPTKAYPAIGGSHEYIFTQAARDIKAATGRTIDPKQIYLMPIPTITANEFRAGKRAHYSVHYVDTSGGQPVYRILNGKAFYAEPREEARAVGTQRRAEFDAARRRAQLVQEGRAQAMSERKWGD